MTNITPILQAAISLCIVIVTVVIVPWFKSLVSEQDFSDTLKWIKIAVSAAEQLYDSTKGAEKKAYVLTFLEEHGLTIDETALDTAIEAAVLELHNTLYG